MTSILIGVGAVSVVYATAVRAGLPEPGTVNPFAGSTATDPAADTLSTSSEVEKTTPPLGVAWQTKTLTNLRQVEDLLDCLEAHGVHERDVQILGESTFLVRWR
jgi:hypothetical protein